MQGPLEFEDGLAYLRKTDILREIMYFSYDRNSDADLYALDAEEVREILEMNRAGQRPESLRTEPEPVMPEFVTAVGDDSISRFDAPRRKRSRKKRPHQNGSGPQNGSGQSAAPGDGQNGGERNGASRQDRQDRQDRQRGGRRGRGGEGGRGEGGRGRARKQEDNA